MLFKFRFWEMLYKGKPQNLQYSRVVVASLDAYPTFFPFVSFHLNEIKSQKTYFEAFLHNTLKKNRTIKSWQKDTTISSRMVNSNFPKKVIWIFAPNFFTKIMNFSKKQKLILKYILEIIYEHKILGCRSVLHTEW